MRLFFGLPIGSAAKDAIGAYLKDLRKIQHLEKIRWVRPELMHVTLIFLGEVPSARLQDLKGWETCFKDCSSVEVTLGPLDAFPNVLFLRVAPPAPLEGIHHRLELFLSKLGFPKESRPYTPHLTFGRSRQKMASFFIPREILQPLQIQDVLSNVTLYESRLAKGGPVYTPLSSVSF